MARCRGVGFARKIVGNQTAQTCSDFLPEFDALC
jgi:hypothetical protein